MLFFDRDFEEEGSIPVPKAERAAAFKKFISYSAIGVALFLIPIYWHNQWAIGVTILANILKGYIKTYLPTFVLVFALLSVTSTLYARIVRPTWITQNDHLKAVLLVNWLWTSLRIIGAIFIVMIYFQFGMEWVYGKNTGSVVMNDLNPTLIPFFFCAITFMSFLTQYGFMEYIGTLLSKIIHLLFKIPGRAAVDASTALFGSTAVAMIFTSLQYDKGFYTEREAAIIMTNFAITPATFCLVVVSVGNINGYFFQFYATVLLTCGILAMIMARIPPLSKKPDTFIKPSMTRRVETKVEGLTLNQTAIRRGMRRAYHSPGLKTNFTNAIYTLMDIYLGLMPVVFAIGTVALALSEYTPIFKWLSYPFAMYLELLRVPEAQAAAPSMVVGFADMFLPVVLGKGIPNEMTRFIIACMSICQIIYLTEVGTLIFKSNIHLNFLELLVIFLIRTVIALPIIVLMANLFF